LELRPGHASPDVTNPGSRRMRLVATGLLLLMAALFIAADSFDERWPALSYLKAFSEAAMVGGLADWFAVTALFRRPLGLPIPHTAIIPSNKDRIATTLASFLRTNFLTPAVVGKRIERIDIAGALARWFVDPVGIGRMRIAFADLAGRLFEALGDEPIGGILKSAAARRLREIEVAPILGSAIEGALADERHEAVLQSALRWADRALTANEALLREIVRERTNWMLRLATVDEAITQQLIFSLRRLFADMAANPEHPLRTKMVTVVRDLAHDLRHDAPMRERVERVKNEVIEHPEVSRTLEQLWTGARESLLRMFREPEHSAALQFDTMLRQLGQAILADEALRAALNERAGQLILSTVDSYGDELVALVSDTVRGWDAATIVDRVETAVSRDLQYIRLNGTLIGGLAGLAIHGAAELL
jgi:uncharacterized membrane-anchored protein YjiN (DUF445 family)